MIPRATYRIQLHRGFRFADAEQVGPYLADLGISHAYLSPIQTARAGSMHGYDVVDHGAINPELGGAEDFEKMSVRFRSLGLGIILDIVPNHMAVGYYDNPWWLDVLRNGRRSPFARHFDIDFDPPDQALEGKILAPFLGVPYAEAITSGEIKLEQRDGEWVVAYHDHVFPLRPEDQALTGVDIAAARTPDGLDRLLERQNFRLGWWRTAGDLINWRRFFDINTLAGLRIEEPSTFEAVHGLVLDLYARELIDGVRVDHIDGLADPAAYCRRLRSELSLRQGDRPPAYIVVEKILAFDEALPAGWPIEGTTGYDFMNEISALLHAESGRSSLASFWRQISGRPDDFDHEEQAARAEILSGFAAQTNHAVAGLAEWSRSDLRWRDVPAEAIGRALRHGITTFRRYRTYATGAPDSPPGADGSLRKALDLDGEPSPESQASALIAEALASDDAAVPVQRINQLTAPIAAKAVEDTAFYRYGLLLSRNDVGFDPRIFSLDSASFHARMAERAREWPHSMLATATHDHKRGEDTRARLAVLSECPEIWIDQAQAWFADNRPHRGIVSEADEYALYQTIVGTWPIDLAPGDHNRVAALSERLKQWRVKAVREAKLRSSWARPCIEYEQACLGQIDALMDPVANTGFLHAVRAFVTLIAASSIANSIAQLALKCLLPGVPDIYQGTQGFDLSMVDPDNRRPIQFGGSLFPALTDAPWSSDAHKCAVLHQLLTLRRRMPDLFLHGSYHPLEVAGTRSRHVVAFERQFESQRVVAVVSRELFTALAGKRQLCPDPSWWGTTRISLRPSLEPLFPPAGGTGRLSHLMKSLPIQVLAQPR